MRGLGRAASLFYFFLRRGSNDLGDRSRLRDVKQRNDHLDDESGSDRSDLLWSQWRYESLEDLAHALVTSHSLTLKSLSQQTVYTYEVQSTDSGGLTTSSTSTFALCNPGNPNSG